VVAPYARFPRQYPPRARTGRCAACRQPGPKSCSAGAAKAEGVPQPAAQAAPLRCGSAEKPRAGSIGCSQCAPSGSSSVRKGARGVVCFGCPSRTTSPTSSVRRDDHGPGTRGPLISLRISRRHPASCRSRRDDRASCRALRELMLQTHPQPYLDPQPCLFTLLEMQRRAAARFEQRRARSEPLCSFRREHRRSVGSASRV
jgi:hypothetical protein